MADSATSGSAAAAANTPNNALEGHWDGVDLERLAVQVGTPVHVYSASAIRDRIAALQKALAGLDAGICYAVKANGNRAILELINGCGVGADIVSVGEMQRALAAGMPASRIVFSGVGKQQHEIVAALQAGIARFNVESRDELDLLLRCATDAAQVTHAAVRINPDVDAGTHAKISTGRAENKFGVDLAEARTWFADLDPAGPLRLDGLHVHIGSQILDLQPFRLALAEVAAFRRELEDAGHPITSIDVGGGLGVTYRQGHDKPPAVGDYVDVIRQALAGFEDRILLEPGRWLMAEAGALLTRVVRVKPGRERRFVIVDAAMNDLLRPALYDAWHDIVPVREHGRPPRLCDIVGPVCETGDTFAVQRQLAECEAGELLMIRGTGAYGASMASTYNSRPLAAEVLLDQGRYAIIRRRQTFDEMLTGEQSAKHWESV